MKLTILQEKLKKGLSIVERIPLKSVSLPILNNILLTAEKNFLSLTATDLEIGIKWWSLVKTEKEGSLAMPAKVLPGFLGFLPNKPISLEKKDFILNIECENYKTQIKGQNPEEFPLIPQVIEKEIIILDSASFCRGLSQVVEFASISNIKPEIAGIYLFFQKDAIKLVATDSFRLAEKNISFKTPLQISQEYALILPQKTAREIINIFGEREGDIRLYLSSNQVLFESLMSETSHPEIQVVSRLIEGEYPNYQEIIPKKYETQFICDRGEFLNQIKAASLFGGKVNEVKLKIDPKKNQVELFSQSPDFGENRSSLPAKIKGDAMEASFNYRFLADGLSNIKSSEVVFELINEERPASLRPVGDQSYLYIVMPIKNT